MRTTVQQRIGKIEAEVKLLKRAVTKRPDLYIDEKNWQKVRTVAKKARAKIFKARYE